MLSYLFSIVQRGYAKGKTNPSRVAHERDSTIKEVVAEGEGRRIFLKEVQQNQLYRHMNVLHVA